MGLTFDQGKAFIHHIVKGTAIRAHLEGHLGFASLPKVKDFDSNEEDDMSRCENLLRYIDECVGVLWSEVSGRPRQGTFDFKGELPARKPSDQKKPAERKAKKKPEPKKKAQPKKAAAKAKK